MIIVHDDLGRIVQTIHDPVPEGMREVLDAHSSLYIEVEPEPIEASYTDPDGVKHVVLRPGILHVDFETQYVDAGKLAKRPAFAFPEELMLIADGENSYTFEDLPANTTLYRGNTAAAVDDGELTITSTMPHTYELRFEAFPYLTKTVKVTTHAA